MNKRVIVIAIVIVALLLVGAVSVFALIHSSTSTERRIVTERPLTSGRQPEQQNSQEGTVTESETQSNKVALRVGSQEFNVTLADNDTARAFREYLPLRGEAQEHGGIEKFLDLPDDSIPKNHTNPGTINNGDIYLYSSKGVILFYKTHRSSYSYTRIGWVDDPQNLAQALGSGDVDIEYIAR